jgi:Ca2+/Na+ antiporter
VGQAKKGYGSLAVANCVGAQVVNIDVGLGLPWLLSALWGHELVLAGHAEVSVKAPPPTAKNGWRGAGRGEVC